MAYRICIILKDDIHKKLRSYQAKLIQKNQSTCSFSQTINHVLKAYFDKK